VNGLERDLRELGRTLDFPATPDLATPVRARLGTLRRREWPSRTRALALAFAVVALAVAIAFAVPPARSAILHFFRIGGVGVERVDRLPSVRLGRRLAPGQRVTPEETRRRAAFRIVLPTDDGYGTPDAIYFSDRIPGGVVFFVYGSRAAPRALLTEFESLHIEFRKFVGRGSSVEETSVGGQPAYWFSGRPHLLSFINRGRGFSNGVFRLATNTLVWRRGLVTFRLEGKLSKGEAMRVARSVP
jgi:hypothetical protein